LTSSGFLILFMIRAEHLNELMFPGMGSHPALGNQNSQ
jgi:hypothetical protein